MIHNVNHRRLKDQSGFTLIEMLVVVIILGILAMIIVPQITVSTEDARLNTLQTNLNTVRSAIELYAAQHSSKYPGMYKETDGTAVTTDAEARTAFLAQMTLFSDINGVTSATPSATYKFGPYVKLGPNTLPTNPYNESSDVVCDFDENDLTAARTAAGAQGWQYFAPLGIFFANDSTAHAAL
jgi:prepilin-type N-terminal cleavage/methylation domain-containing protein